ncbi:hypothetical protein JRQ81_014480 [Phrynocephalus forsythii]|uniref:E3 ubiquitin-protein ligase RNF182 n=1 Tax=Phrynocephalus forsythii TaxID=171643 RepID=A0A9Q0XXU2_9SAUR|nr:hypothetical protein JRQ81_014480 [Phrynocephalus forsythii]
MMSPAGLSVAKAPECQICYEAFDGRARRPHRLPCRHRVCARCLRGMAAAAEAPGGSLRCPFCRRQAPMPGQDDDAEAEAEALLLGRRLPGPAEEEVLLLCPGSIPESLATASPSPSPSDCLVVTLLEVPGEEAASASAPGGLLELLRLYRRASLASVRCSSPPGKRGRRPSGAAAAAAGGPGGPSRGSCWPSWRCSPSPRCRWASTCCWWGASGRAPSWPAWCPPASSSAWPPASAGACGTTPGARLPGSPPQQQQQEHQQEEEGRPLPPAAPPPARPPSGSAAAAAGFAEPLPGAGGRPGESRDPSSLLRTRPPRCELV